MGIVYKARDTKLERYIALKFRRGAVHEGEVSRARLLHKAKNASANETRPELRPMGSRS